MKRKLVNDPDWFMPPPLRISLPPTDFFQPLFCLPRKNTRDKIHNNEGNNFPAISNKFSMLGKITVKFHDTSGTISLRHLGA